VEKTKIRDRDAGEKVSLLDPGENGRRIENFIGENEYL
jgi:hypothetical protein